MKKTVTLPFSPEDVASEKKLDKEKEWNRQIDKAIKERYMVLLKRWSRILIWYETADRSAESWAELDKIMAEEREQDE